MASYLGSKELQEYIASEPEPDFKLFIAKNKNDIAVWSSSFNICSALDLFTIWENRYKAAWNLDSIKGKKQCPRITVKDTLYLWQSIENIIHAIKSIKGEHAHEAFTIPKGKSSFPVAFKQASVDTTRTQQTSIETLDQLENSSSSEQSSCSSPDDILPVYQYNNNNIPVPLANKRYNINQFDVSLAFHAFQSVASKNIDTMNIELNVSHILALSSIFLIQREKCHPDLIGVFTEEKLKDIFNDQCKRFKTRKYNHTSIRNVDQITSIIKNVKNDLLTRENGIIETYRLGFTPSPLSLVTTTITNLPTPTFSASPEQQSPDHQEAVPGPLLPLPKNVNKILKCVVNLIEKLPNQDIKEDFLELEFYHRFIDPILSGLFDDPDNGILFRWTIEPNEESEHEYMTRKCPDGTITLLDGLYFGPSLGFVDVKSAKREHDKHVISNDLVRLGLLSKNAIDQSNANGCLVIQVRGLTLDFYITKLAADGMYTMFHLYSLKAPSSIESLQGFVAYFDEILSILDIFDEHCLTFTTGDTIQHSFKRKSLSDEAFDTILSKMKSNKRPCYTSYNQ
ncbi:hypothetical protein BDC45DRAFT_519070 [Circinella umbellata]|nr:hypothetical protein BDC45DRAFT_519070 [Circinella umbellata]